MKQNSFNASVATDRFNNSTEKRTEKPKVVFPPSPSALSV